MTKEHKETKTHKKEPAKKESGSDVQLWLLGAQVLLLLVLVYQVGTLDMGAAPTVVEDDEPTPPAAPTPTPAPSPTLDMEELIDDDSVKGNADAPVTIVEWSDYECPFCAKFYRETYSQINEQYIKTGKVKLVYRDFPLSFHPQAQKAAEAAECAGEQGDYYGMHDLLFEKGVTGGVATFKQYAADMGLDQAEFDECLDSGAMASEVSKDMADGQAAGIRGTPGFVVNGRVISGAQPFSVFKQAIDAALQ